MKRVTKIVLGLALCLTAKAHAFTYDDVAKTAQSDGSRSDTQDAITHAINDAHDGWIVTIGSPSGSYTWSDAGLNVVSNYNLTIQGDATHPPTITASHTGGYDIFVTNNDQSAKHVTFQNLIFAPWSGDRLFLIDGTGFVLHLTNVTATGQDPGNVSWFTWWAGAEVGGGEGAGPFGLVDHCTLNKCGNYIRQNLGAPENKGIDGTGTGWTNSYVPTWGTANAVFFEDDTINGVGVAGGLIAGAVSVTDGNQAGKLTFRHCIINNTRIAWHGRDSGGSTAFCHHGFLMGEIYNNTYNISIPMTGPLVQIRSGTALVWGNTYSKTGSGDIPTFVQLQMDCDSGSYVSCRNASDCSAMTQPLQFPADYPDLQQPGLGGAQPVRVWQNCTGLDCTGTGIASGLAAGDTNFTQGFAHDGGGPEFIVSADNSVKPIGYVPYTYPHPMNTGSTPSAPSNISPPQLTGTATQGQILTVLQGSYAGFPVPTLTEQFQACNASGLSCVNIGGATGTSYTISSAQVGSTVRVCETATNTSDSVTVCSAISGVVSAPGAENRLTNGGFEIHTGAHDGNNGSDAAWAGWVTSSGVTTHFFETTTSESHTGTAAFKVRNYNGATGWLRQLFVPSAVGTDMALSFWENNSSYGHGPIVRIVDFTGCSDITGSCGTESVNVQPNYVPAFAADYHQFFVGWTVPSGCTAAYLEFNTSGGDGGEDVRLDDIIMTPPAPPPPLAAPSRIFRSSVNALRRRP